MLLSKATTIKVTDVQSNIVGHMGYAAYKLWNVCKYERDNHEALGLTDYPDWYYQKKAHKDNIWYRQLPSQTAQEVCKQLDKGYKSFFSLLKSKGIEEPKPPKYKHSCIPVTYMQNGIMHEDDTLRLTLSKSLKQFMADEYGIHASYLYLKNRMFQVRGTIKQLKLYMPEDNVMRIIIVYEIPDVQLLPYNGNILAIDMGVHNPLTTYDNVNHTSMIYGRQYASMVRNYEKLIAHYKSISDAQQSALGIKYSKMSNRVKSLYTKKRNSIKDLFHKATRSIVSYCVENDIRTVVIGDITGIREDNDHGDANNQTFHALPYRQIAGMFRYKLAMCGIELVQVSEAYTSRTSPKAKAVDKTHAVKSNRKKRGLYKDGADIYNADSVGAYNIMRVYLQKCKKSAVLKYDRLSSPTKVAV